MYLYNYNIMDDDYGQYYIIDDHNFNLKNDKKVRIIDKIQNKSKPVLVSQINDKILQANDVSLFQNTPIYLCGLCMFMITVYNFPIVPMFL